MRRTNLGYRALAIAMALLSNACYTYASSGLATGLPPETRVAARLTSRATADYERQLGPDVERVEGTLTRVTPDSVELRLEKTLNRNGDWTTWGGEAVSFGSKDLATVGQRRFSRTKTLIAVGGLLAAVILMLSTDLLGFGGTAGSSDPRPIPPGNPG
jgi:hypothetical protein